MNQTEATQPGKTSKPRRRRIPTEDAMAKAAEHKTEQYQKAEMAIQNAMATTTIEHITLGKGKGHRRRGQRRRKTSRERTPSPAAMDLRRRRDTARV
ncbi:hypothetical protein U1Q18_016435 [Sarracenia purpurea var. burkii]